jgi:hypothetical protein
MSIKNNPIESDRTYIARRDGDQVIVEQVGPCGLHIPILGALRHPDGVLLVDTAIPVPSDILRECLYEVERVMLKGGAK